jgi:hypothetical protein
LKFDAVKLNVPLVVVDDGVDEVAADSSEGDVRSETAPPIAKAIEVLALGGCVLPTNNPRMLASIGIASVQPATQSSAAAKDLCKPLLDILLKNSGLRIQASSNTPILGEKVKKAKKPPKLDVKFQAKPNALVVGCLCVIDEKLQLCAVPDFGSKGLSFFGLVRFSNRAGSIYTDTKYFGQLQCLVRMFSEVSANRSNPASPFVDITVEAASTFSDDKTAYKQREGLSEMMKKAIASAANSGEMVFVVVSCVSRLSRMHAQVIEIVRELQEGNVGVLFSCSPNSFNAETPDAESRGRELQSCSSAHSIYSRVSLTMRSALLKAFNDDVIDENSDLRALLECIVDEEEQKQLDPQLLSSILCGGGGETLEGFYRLCYCRISPTAGQRDGGYAHEPNYIYRATNSLVVQLCFICLCFKLASAFQNVVPDVAWFGEEVSGFPTRFEELDVYVKITAFFSKFPNAKLQLIATSIDRFTRSSDYMKRLLKVRNGAVEFVVLFQHGEFKPVRLTDEIAEKELEIHAMFLKTFPNAKHFTATAGFQNPQPNSTNPEEALDYVFSSFLLDRSTCGATRNQHNMQDYYPGVAAKYVQAATIRGGTATLLLEPSSDSSSSLSSSSSSSLSSPSSELASNKFAVTGVRVINKFSSPAKISSPANPLISPTQEKGNTINQSVSRPWSPNDNESLKQLVNQHGTSNWALLARNLNKVVEGIRTDDGCRFQWGNINSEVALTRGKWSKVEDAILLKLMLTEVEVEGRQIGKSWQRIFPLRVKGGEPINSAGNGGMKLLIQLFAKGVGARVRQSNYES